MALVERKMTVSKDKGTCRTGCFDLEGKNMTVKLSDALYVPSLESNLISVRKRVSNDGTVIVLKNTHRAAKVEEKSHTINCQHTWHRKMGHRDNHPVQNLMKKDLVTGLKIENCGLRIQCECCLEAKFARLPFPKESKKSSKGPLALVHVDVCGPMKNITQGGCRYYLAVIEDYSRYLAVYFLREKSDAEEKLKDFVMEMKTIFGRPPKFIRLNNGGEFRNKAMETSNNGQGVCFSTGEQHLAIRPVAPPPETCRLSVDFQEKAG